MGAKTWSRTACEEVVMVVEGAAISWYVTKEDRGRGRKEDTTERS